MSRCYTGRSPRPPWPPCAAAGALHFVCAVMSRLSQRCGSRKLSDDDRPDYFYVDGFGQAPDVATVQVALHVIRGRIHELEVFAGEGIAVSLASLTDLTD